jgi:hypothetical protein
MNQQGKRMKLHFLAAVAAFALAGCGGGGGGGSAATPIALDSLQGFWSGSLSGSDFGGASKVRAVVLSNGATWLFLHGSTTSEPLVGLATTTLSVDGEGFVGTGTRYGTSGEALASFTVSGNPAADRLLVSAKSDASTTSSLDLAYENRYEVAAVQADVVGGWTFTKQGGTIQATWTIAADGALSGTSTLGCTYSGQVVPHGKVAVFDVTITERCTGTTKELTGIGRLNTAKTFLTFGLTTGNGAQAEALAAQKAPA